MRTPKEIKNALECRNAATIGACMYRCQECRYYNPGYGSDQITMDTLALIDQFEDNIAEKDEYIQQLKADLEAVKRERDAAVEDAAMGECCETCLYGDIPVLQNPCMSCYEYNLWKWRGVCPENTEVQEDER